MRYFYEALLELLICGVAGYKMWEVRSVWTPSDKIAFVILIIMDILTVIYIVFLFRFLCCH